VSPCVAWRCSGDAGEGGTTAEPSPAAGCEDKRNRRAQRHFCRAVGPDPAVHHRAAGGGRLLRHPAGRALCSIRACHIEALGRARTLRPDRAVEDRPSALLSAGCRSVSPGRELDRTTSRLLGAPTRRPRRIPGQRGRPMQSTSAETPGTGIGIELQRRFRASPERIFRAWTQPAALREW